MLQPTVLTGVRPGMKVIDEEIFAPVVSVLPFHTLEGAIDGSNALPFGLATGIFTRQIGRSRPGSCRRRPACPGRRGVFGIWNEIPHIRNIA